jgi:phosphate transport system permease protein
MNVTMRLARDKVMLALCVAALALALLPLAAILSEVVGRGIGSLSVEFLTGLPKPAGEQGGGFGNALLGTGTVVGLAAAIGVPVGVGAGIYLNEFGDTNVLGRSARFMAEVLSGLPSIVAGIVGYELVVVTVGRFSALAGGVALSFLFIPVVAIATQEALRLVPRSQREASLALGMGHAPTSLRVVLPAAMGGVITGIMLAVARVAGETAPLLFTAFNNSFWPKGIDQPTATLPVQIFVYAISPFRSWHDQAWAGALTLVLLVLATNVVVRTLWARRLRFMRGAM